MFALLFIWGCSDEFLDRNPLDSPSSSTFYSSEADLILAVNSAYRELNRDLGTGGGTNIFMQYEIASDNVWSRCEGSLRPFANGTADPSNSEALNNWRVYYRGIAKCNTLLENMPNAEAKTNPDVFKRVDGEARFLRAYFYGLLIELYGDVPLLTKTLSREESFVTRNPKAEVLSFVLEELDAAAVMLPEAYSGNDRGRATKGAALAYKARIALYNGQFAEAAAAAKEVMDMGVYELYPNFRDLFTYAGEGSKETILAVGYAKSVAATHGSVQHNSTRLGSGWSCVVPARELVDAFYCEDGLPIDESPLFDPANPYENRDPRMKQSIVSNGDVHFGWPYYVHPDSAQITNPTTGVKRQNLENSLYTGAGSPASNTGHVMIKYVDQADAANPQQVELDFMLIRYAEVLLTYAEAKIELGQTDQTVLDAINAVRGRAGMPAVSSTDQTALRKLVRYERRIELFGEGFRMFDIKRWDIGNKAFNRTMLARPKLAWWNEREYPQIDDEGFPDYSAINISAKYDIMEIRTHRPDRNYLWPIPQSEIDVNPNLSQNTGY